MNRRRFLVLLQASCASLAMPFTLSNLLGSPNHIVEVDLKFPYPMSGEEFEKHLVQMQKHSQVTSHFQEFLRTGRMKLIEQKVDENSGRWVYGFVTREDVKAWASTIRENRMVNKNYLGGAFVWSCRLNGQIIS